MVRTAVVRAGVDPSGRIDPSGITGDFPTVRTAIPLSRGAAGHWNGRMNPYPAEPDVLTGRQRTPANGAMRSFAAAVTDEPQPQSVAHRDESRTRRGRPALLMLAWCVLLGAAAGLAPILQNALGVPWELLALIMLAPAVVSGILRICVPRWFPAPWSAVPWRSVLVPVVLALVFVVVFMAIHAALAGSIPSFPSAVAGVPLAVFVVVQAIGALGEEIGWRGVMQRAGEQFVPPPVATIILGTLFGATHLGYWEQGPVFVAWFTASSVAMAAAMMIVWRGGFWQRMIPATIIHLGVNMSAVALATQVRDVDLWMMPLPAVGALAVVVLVRRLFARHPVLRPAGSAAVRTVR